MKFGNVRGLVNVALNDAAGAVLDEGLAAVGIDLKVGDGRDARQGGTYANASHASADLFHVLVGVERRGFVDEPCGAGLVHEPRGAI